MIITRIKQITKNIKLNVLSLMSLFVFIQKPKNCGSSFFSRQTSWIRFVFAVSCQLLVFSRKVNVSPFPPKKQPHLGTSFFISFFFGGGVVSSCDYDPCSFSSFWPRSSSVYCLCLLFWFVFSSYCMITSLGFFILVDFSW